MFLSLIKLFEIHIFKYLYLSAQKLHEESEDQQGAKQPVEEFENQEGEQVLVSLESTEEDFPCYSSSDDDFSDDSVYDSWKNIPSSSTHLHAEPNSSEVYTLASGDRIMFEKSGQTVRDVIEMIVAYSLRFGDSNEARNMLIEMFKICVGPEFENVKFSNYKLA